MRRLGPLIARSSGQKISGAHLIVTCSCSDSFGDGHYGWWITREFSRELGMVLGTSFRFLL
jgi:hypothetical protein